MERLPAFYFDLASLEAYLSAERILSLMPAPVEWIGVSAGELAAPSDPAGQVGMAGERIASRGLQELRLPDPFPFDSRRPMLAATYARQIGRAVPFALAAWRQSFAAGRTLDDDGIAIAGSSCEMHPSALLKAVDTAAVAGELDGATALARERQVRDVPAVWVPGAGNEPDLVFHGDDELEAAAAAVGERVPAP
ncbi:MAG: DsbA family protein [Solirubrobacterales bacterium]